MAHFSTQGASSQEWVSALVQCLTQQAQFLSSQRLPQPEGRLLVHAGQGMTYRSRMIETLECPAISETILG